MCFTTDIALSNNKETNIVIAGIILLHVKKNPVINENTYVLSKNKLLNKRNPYLTSVAYYLDFGNYNPHYLVPNCSVINLESNDGNHKRFAQSSTLPE